MKPTKDELLAWLDGLYGYAVIHPACPVEYFSALRALIERAEKVDALLEKVNATDGEMFDIAGSIIRRSILVKGYSPMSKINLGLDNIIGLLQDLAALRSVKEG